MKTAFFFIGAILFFVIGFFSITTIFNKKIMQLEGFKGLRLIVQMVAPLTRIVPDGFAGWAGAETVC